MHRINAINFTFFTFFLPYTSIFYFRSIFRIWANNVAVYFFLIGLMLIILDFAYKNKQEIHYQSKQFLLLIFFFSGLTLLTSYIMSYYLMIFTSITTFPDAKTPLDGLRVSFLLGIPLIIFYVVQNLKTLQNLKFFIKVIIISFIVVIFYGYLQIYCLYNQDSGIYAYFLPLISIFDQGWNGTNTKIFGDVPYFIYVGRINLFTPEASEAGHIILSFLYPFLLSSMIVDYSIFKFKVFRLNIETFVFILSIPILLVTFSSSAYYVFAFLIILMVYYKIRISKNKLVTLLLLIMIFLILSFCIYYFIYDHLPQFIQDKVMYFITKIFDSDSTSTSTRLGGIIAALKIFLNYPIFGVGFGNIRYILINYLPLPLNVEQMAEYSTGIAFNPKSLSLSLLAQVGIVGMLVLIYFFYKLWFFLKKLSKKNLFAMYIYYAFIIFLFSALLESFNSSFLGFIWIWVMIGFFIASSNKEIYINKVTKKGITS